MREIRTIDQDSETKKSNIGKLSKGLKNLKPSSSLRNSQVSLRSSKQKLEGIPEKRKVKNRSYRIVDKLVNNQNSKTSSSGRNKNTPRDMGGDYGYFNPRKRSVRNSKREDNSSGMLIRKFDQRPFTKAFSRVKNLER